ncbi:SAM-dependent methyltransferase [Halalkaliarchaeum sp. AArc-CO]|uniref:class I SAM-dependent methyltransferase n=1 Tax=Halalkaliarchaeum sp. AArc-CO TaxID=2866381 RepID=UPI00217EA27B|nr:class I SAM-dependent methyltransferase [Halalkaliarchaeum sp. AArc-CO]UWG51304.1 SAM-dependent methyltransferase [Halalkaliarchaeum sp. AArc-CO]
MTDIERRPEDETEYNEYLQRSETVWNRWSEWYRLSEQDFEPIREALLDSLDIEVGDRVLEIGCGPGVNFGMIRDAIGSSGRLVAVDYSPEMIAKANARIATNGWENVDVVRADATTADLGGPYDAAIATLALGVMPDIERAVQNIHSSLEPGAPLGVLDIRPFQSGLRRVVNPLLRWVLSWYANWNPNEDVPTAVDGVFGGYDQFQTYMLGTVYTLEATRRNSRD